jgi:hypothetical protein
MICLSLGIIYLFWFALLERHLDVVDEILHGYKSLDSRVGNDDGKRFFHGQYHTQKRRHILICLAGQARIRANLLGDKLPGDDLFDNLRYARHLDPSPIPSTSWGARRRNSLFVFYADDFFATVKATAPANTVGKLGL